MSSSGNADHERMRRDLATYDAAELKGNLEASARLILAVGAAAPLMMAGVDGGALALGSVLFGRVKRVVELAWEQLKADRKEPTIDKVGPEALYTIAHRAAAKSEWLSRHWQTLLRNAMDPSFEHDIRPEDIELANTLHTSDFVLVAVLARCSRDMQHEWFDQLAHAKSFAAEMETNAGVNKWSGNGFTIGPGAPIC